MSLRSKRISRLCDITGRQEEIARLGMVRAGMAVREAEMGKQQARERTIEALRSTTHSRLRGALHDASVRSDVRHDEMITSSREQLDVEARAWETARQRAGSITKLLERIVDREQVAAQRAAERELGDVISSRVAMRLNAGRSL